jgi:hypothetical protein
VAGRLAVAGLQAVVVVDFREEAEALVAVAAAEVGKS